MFEGFSGAAKPGWLAGHIMPPREPAAQLAEQRAQDRAASFYRHLRGPGASLARSTVVRIKTYPARRTMIAARARTTEGLILLDGLACEQCFLADGSRQITALSLPGDVLNLEAILLQNDGPEVFAIQRCRVGVGPLAIFAEALRLESPGLGRRLLSRRVAIDREWLVALGRRSALARTAHLFCELMVRLQEAGLSDGRSFRLSMSQTELADMLSLSTVHTNRIVQALRRGGLISWRRGVMQLLDRHALEATAGFCPDYLEIH